MIKAALAPKSIKHDPAFNDAIERAVLDFRTPNSMEMIEKCPYLFSSDLADAYWITAWALYHTGHKPIAMKRSRGNSWLVDFYGWSYVRVWVEKPDHREGIRAEDSK